MHRMFSSRVTSSAKFLKMPLSTQALYFHLGIHADDDGIVEAFSVLRCCGANEDDLRVLVAKGYAVILNEDLVTYLTDWRENNKIRADRKRDSIYKDLLLQMVPDVDLVEAKPTYYQRQKDKICQTNGGQLPAVCQPKISKDKGIEDKGIEDKKNNSSIVIFWEQNMTPITPVIADTLTELVKDYGEPIVIEAIKEAAKRGIRNIRYVEGVAHNMFTEGPKKSQNKKKQDLKATAEKVMAEMQEEKENADWLGF